MSSVPGVDHPEEQTEVDIRLTGADLSVTARVELVHDGVISVRPSTGEYVGQSVATVGDRVEVFWKTDDGHRAVPAEVTGVEEGAVVRWRLTGTGPAEHRQRRMAVRGHVALPIEADFGGGKLTGKTVDLSENGCRAQCEGFGLPPEPGTAMGLSIGLEDGALRVRAEVIRLQIRGAQWMLSVRFPHVEERDQDRIRRRVFQALREERARLAE